tara:strand:- start:222 stop:557 length:336 start_codon:yes stop_codon:yes gene_type:complete
MNPLQNFEALKTKLGEYAFYEHCKRILLEKENYSKIVIQKAQQFLDEFKVLAQKPVRMPSEYFAQYKARRKWLKDRTKKTLKRAFLVWDNEKKGSNYVAPTKPELQIQKNQ